MQVLQKIRHVFSLNRRHSERKAPYTTQIIRNNHLQENVKDNPLVALYKDVRILTDDIEIDPIHNFELYSKTVVNMIRSSDPKFCVGISGDWGTGKTTLMKSIEENLKKQKKRK